VSYKVTNNRSVHGFYTGFPCGVVLHINLLTSTERSGRHFMSQLYDFGHVIIRSVIKKITLVLFAMIKFKAITMNDFLLLWNPV
jgi:hypothetical protein